LPAPAAARPTLPIPAHVPLVTATRGSTVEMVHVGSIAVVDIAGRLIAGVGDPQALNFTRSALKPLQALPFVRDDGLAHFGFGSHELALLCASHNGEAVHVRTVDRILRAIGARESDLQCGCHPPTFFSATGTRAPEGATWSPRFHNCSGKHSGFLAYCRLHGHRIGDYLAVDAAVQTRIRNTLVELARGDPIALGIDGCSAPNFALPLTRLAHLYARLACDDDAAFAALRYAMTRHPDLVSGAGRTDLALMTLGSGDWVSKIGADGVQTVGVRSRGIGLAVRIADGNPRALAAATAAALLQLGLVDTLDGTPLAAWERPALRNYRGTVVGGLEPAFALPRLAG
jgi:L-asparaginase II